MNVPILFEDDYIVCASKPNNVVVHHAHHSRNVADEASLLQLLQEQCGEKMYPIHRLDRKTSGIILLAKKSEYVAKFQELFMNNQIQKTYYGIVRGHAPETKIIDSPVKGRDANVHKEAETHLATEKKVTINIPVKPYDTSRYSLVKLTPKTGRLHQLRIHMNKISHPLIGDPKYGDKNHNMMFLENFNCENLFLHAHSLEFIHPYSNKKLEVIADFPQDWNTVFEKFGW
ncbi:tRNA pseudouridine synthase C [Tenacibaculum lutimaris]|uniref:tRNA pseudouridine synthase C n=1 Tax=Tenacibaculum lutimaris TaxID=285258 RepID=A0A420E1D5_9FLAO|nr:pseudouridine synthase [Tenacibaculum lutimaris]RKF03878.1 tRNA pseudouridine synthase C [Tenacibaculum lutimaris]